MALTSFERQSRREFRQTYSSDSARIIQRIARGESSQDIASKLHVPRTTVTTTKGNLTRGVYAPFAFVGPAGKVEGFCAF